MTKYIASVSFGKDSLAMLLKVVETGMYPLDEVVFVDTGMEFQAIYTSTISISTKSGCILIFFSAVKIQWNWSWIVPN